MAFCIWTSKHLIGQLEVTEINSVRLLIKPVKGEDLHRECNL